MKVSVSAQTWSDTLGIYVPFSLRHLNFTFYRYDVYPSVYAWSTVSLTDLFGDDSATFKTTNQANGKYAVKVFYVGAPDKYSEEYFSIGQTSIENPLGRINSTNEPNQNKSNQKSTSNESIPVKTIPMKDTGTPINMLVLSILTLVGGLIYTKK